jgi:hypothetical protein
MGACSFTNTGRGKTMSEAYSNLCEDAREEYGHQDGYNGTISTTSGFRDVTSDFKRSGKSLQNFIDDNIDRAEKWGSCLAICIEEPKGNTNKVKSQVKNIVTPGTKKWVLKYVVTDSSGRTIASKTTKGDAVKVAREHTEKTQARTYIDMVKVLEKGSTKVAEIEYKKSTTEKQGKFVFFGWAAE